ncbi:hypothetical protein N752_12630 [Desulforamulus aquiferis]|nr:hypothetical protein [Desulforamulus aquiferis]RYD04764.1 hypothetical protein N752_12630 [Desulforamulus aquiferis]
MFKKLAAFVAVMMMSVLLVGCGGGGTQEEKQADSNKVYNIKIGSPVVETHPA